MTTRHHLVSVAKLINPCILDLDLDLVLGVDLDVHMDLDVDVDEKTQTRSGMKRSCYQNMRDFLGPGPVQLNM